MLLHTFCCCIFGTHALTPLTSIIASLICLPATAFEQMDLRVTQTSSRQQQIVEDPGGRRTVVEIRGIDNGIAVNYIFEKHGGAWMLAEIRDSST
ncbi:MAG: hypothetical protein NW241_14375 [Bacteroidia bacterium]|nr:hypothetical protein [Bacteroidia bacterium]